jgi:hypothetical protein
MPRSSNSLTAPAVAGKGPGAECLVASPFGHLADNHYQKALGSGWEGATIIATQVYTEYVTAALHELGIWADAPALVFPFFDPWGRRTSYAVARPDRGVSKYRCPKGPNTPPYYPPFQWVWDAIRAAGGLLAITEGILKAALAAQCKIPCVGLMGVWNWGKKGENDVRLLHPDLEAIDWRGKVVPWVFDLDPARNPNVHQAVTESARLLTGRGAEVFLLHPPPGIVGPDGRPVKQAIDDFYMTLKDRIGKEAAARLWEWLEARLTAPPVRPLGPYRERMITRRGVSLSRPGVYYDASPTGAGKSYADIEALWGNEEAIRNQHYATPEEREKAMKNLPRSLTTVPTHANCAEVVQTMRARGLEAVAYPRLDDNSCAKHKEALAVINRGLSFSKVLCPECEYRRGCPYREQFVAAAEARHAVATHARAEVSLPDLVKSRQVLSLHETPLEVLRPSFVTDCGLEIVDMVARSAMYEAAREDRHFYRHLGRVALMLNGELKSALETTELELPGAAREPEDAHKLLNDACCRLADPPAAAMKLALAAAGGSLSLLSVAVDVEPAPPAPAPTAAVPGAGAPQAGGAKEDGGVGKSPTPGRPACGVKLVRRLVGVTQLGLPAEAVVWLGDATGSREELERVLGRPVVDMTPAGRLEPLQDVLQIVPKHDVTKRMEPATALPLLRAVLHDHPRYKRVGLLTHMNKAKELQKLLGEPYKSRLAHVSHFHSGLSRGSNVWIDSCDCLIVLGTPRVGDQAVRQRLIRLGMRHAASRTREEAGWEWDWWSAVTVSGRRLTVKTKHHTDHDWHAAYCYLVRSELVQAVGRGRGILPEGIPVIVVTTENLAPCADGGDLDGRGGPRVADALLAPLTDAQLQVLGCLYRNGRRVVRTSPEIAALLGMSTVRACALLGELRGAGRVRQVGERGGWYVPSERNRPR